MAKEVETPPETEPGADLDKAINDAFDEVEAKAENEETPPEQPEAEAEAEAEAESESADGPGEEEAAQASEEDAPPGEEPGEDDGPLEPLAKWSAEDKERFASLPREAQEFLLDREKSRDADHTRKTQDIADQRKRYDALAPVLDPIRQEAQAAGQTEAQALASLYGAHRALQTNPREALKRIARSYGIDGLQFEGAAPDPATSEFDDPLKTEVAALKEKVEGFENQTRQQKEAAQNARLAEVNGQIADFASATDESGAPKYPHYEKLRPAMAGLFNAGTVETLEDAYEKAGWADPEVRAEWLKAKADDEAKAREAKRKEDAAKAKKAGRNVKPKSPATERKEKLTLDERIEAAFDEAESRAS